MAAYSALVCMYEVSPAAVPDEAPAKVSDSSFSHVATTYSKAKKKKPNMVDAGNATLNVV